MIEDLGIPECMKTEVVSSGPSISAKCSASLLDEKRVGIVPIVYEPVMVEEGHSLIRALSVMEKHGVRDLPAVRERYPVGIASRVDIGRVFLLRCLRRKAPQTREEIPRCDPTGIWSTPGGIALI